MECNAVGLNQSWSHNAEASCSSERVVMGGLIEALWFLTSRTRVCVYKFMSRIIAVFVKTSNEDNFFFNVWSDGSGQEDILLSMEGFRSLQMEHKHLDSLY